MPKYTPQYKPFDLGAYDPALAGEVIQLLQNPTREFYGSFITSQGEAFLKGVAFVCGVPVGELDALLDGYERALFTWLFVPWQDDTGQWIMPEVYRQWDAAAQATIKKLRQRSGAPAAVSVPAPESASEPASS